MSCLDLIAQFLGEQFNYVIQRDNACQTSGGIHNRQSAHARRLHYLNDFEYAVRLIRRSHWSPDQIAHGEVRIIQARSEDLDRNITVGNHACRYIPAFHFIDDDGSAGMMTAHAPRRFLKRRVAREAIITDRVQNSLTFIAIFPC